MVLNSRGVFLLWASLLSLIANAPASPARITGRGTTWTLQNDVLKVVIAFSKGSIDMTSFYNKAAAVDYLAGQGTRHLFQHRIEGQTVAADDGGWVFAGATINDIDFHDKLWGRQLAVTVARSRQPKFSVRLVFELYDGRGGLRYCTFLKNNDLAGNLTITASDVLAVNFPNWPHTLAYVPDNTLWTTTTGRLSDGRRNCLVRYDTGDGWAINLENNFCTSVQPGQFKGDYNHTFLHLTAWDAIDHVRVWSDPAAVELTLFPGEEVEYFSVNLEVFKGDLWDARVAVSEHLRLRFKFDPTRIVSINDWQWFTSGNRTDAYYRNVAVPAVMEAGLDRVHVDDYWNGNGGTFLRDSDLPLTTFTTNLPVLGRWIESQGLQLGLWFQPSGSGTDGWGAWGGGRDLADPATIVRKTDQVENTLIAKYRSWWDQVDCGLLWKSATNNAWSHTNDSVYRKALGLRNFMNYFSRKYPGFIMQSTCEVDNPSNFGRESVGLLHLAENGIAGLFRRTESHDNVKDMFNAIGMFPLEGMLETYGEDRQDDVWRARSGWYYEWLLGRHTSIYYNLESLTPEVRRHMRLFNDWRRSPRMNSLLNEVVRPVYNGPGNDNSGPWAWMFVDEPKATALLIAVGGANTSTPAFTPALRWLDPAKTYLVEDVTLQDDGSWHYAFKGKLPGVALASSGFPVNLRENPSRGKAFWLRAYAPRAGALSSALLYNAFPHNPTRDASPNLNRPLSLFPTVLYADDHILSWTETRTGSTLTVKARGLPNTPATVIVYKPRPNGTEVKTLVLDSRGEGQVRFFGDAVTPNPVDPPSVAPVSRTFADQLEVTLGAAKEAGPVEIHYTLDSSTPTAASPRYTAPIRLQGTATLKAIAVLNGIESRGVSATYTARGPIPPFPQVALSSVQPLRATAGWGDHPRKNLSIQDKPLSIAGTLYTNGIGTHAISEMEYELKPGYARFVAIAGVDDEMASYTQSSVVFEAWIDGQRATQSPVMRLGDFYYFNLPIPMGSKTLRLVAGDAGDGYSCDHADWANAGFLGN